LGQLEAEKLWQKGEIKLYHSKLTEIIREYIEYRFHVLALESTTEEILERFKEGQINDELFDKLRTMLELADLVKFARQRPLPDEHTKSMELAHEFVRATRLKPVENNKEVINA